MARLIDWQDILNMDKGGNVIVAMSTLQAFFLQACSAFYQNRYTWVYGNFDVTDEQWDAIQTLQSETELALMGNMVGLILPNVLADITNIGVLDCDGQTYLRLDYPLLYAAIGASYIIDADNFRVPDLRDIFLRGASAINPIGTVGGNDEIILSVAEMPSHAHGYTTPTFNIDIESVGVPDPTGVGLPQIPATTGNTGGNEAHNNIPKFEAVSYVIVAG